MSLRRRSSALVANAGDSWCVPTDSVKIDWGNPISQGLRAFFVPGGRRFDFVGMTPDPTFNSSVTIAQTAFGPVASFPSAGDISVADCAAVGSAMVGAGTIFVLANITNFSSQRAIACKTNNNIPNPYDMNYAGGSGGAQLVTGDGGGYTLYSAAGASSGVWFTGSFSRNAGNSAGQYHHNGSPISTSGGFGAGVTNNSQPLLIGRRSDGGGQMNGYIAMLAMWDRELSTTEVVALNAAPFGLLVPEVARRIFLLNPASGGGPLAFSGMTRVMSFNGFGFSAPSVLSAVGRGRVIGPAAEGGVVNISATWRLEGVARGAEAPIASMAASGRSTAPGSGTELGPKSYAGAASRSTAAGRATEGGNAGMVAVSRLEGAGRGAETPRTSMAATGRSLTPARGSELGPKSYAGISARSNVAGAALESAATPVAAVSGVGRAVAQGRASEVDVRSFTLRGSTGAAAHAAEGGVAGLTAVTRLEGVGRGIEAPRTSMAATGRPMSIGRGSELGPQPYAGIAARSNIASIALEGAPSPVAAIFAAGRSMVRAQAAGVDVRSFAGRARAVGAALAQEVGVASISARARLSAPGWAREAAPTAMLALASTALRSIAGPVGVRLMGARGFVLGRGAMPVPPTVAPPLPPETRFARPFTGQRIAIPTAKDRTASP